MLTERKAIIRHVVEDIWNQGQLNRVDDFFTVKCSFYSPLVNQPISGRENLKRWISSMHTSICDLQMLPMGCLIVEGDEAAGRWKLTGTQFGMVFEMGSGGRSFELEGITTYRFEGNRIAEAWMCHDASGLKQQLRMMSDLQILGATQRPLSSVVMVR